MSNPSEDVRWGEGERDGKNFARIIRSTRHFLATRTVLPTEPVNRLNLFRSSDDGRKTGRDFPFGKIRRRTSKKSTRSLQPPARTRLRTERADKQRRVK